MTCSATAKRTGEPCKRNPRAGSPVCPVHGGAARQVRDKAARRVAEAEALAALSKMDIKPVSDPLGELALLAGEAKAWRDLLRGRVAELNSLGYQGATGEQVRAAVSLYGSALDRLERVLTSIARLRIDERRVAIEEAQADLIAEVIRAAFAEVGLNPEQAALAEVAVGHAFLRLVG